MAKKKKQTERPIKPGQMVLKQVRIHYRAPADLRTVFANNFTVNSDGNSFYLSFYEAPPPFIMGTPDEVAKQVAQLDSVTANCVARVVVPAGDALKILNALGEQVAKQSEKHAAVEAMSKQLQLPQNGQNGKKPTKR